MAQFTREPQSRKLMGADLFWRPILRSARIDVFDSTFKQVRLDEDAFDDERLPRDFAPFNVQGVGPNIYVTYAKQDAARHDPVKPGDPGDGFVDVFSSH